MKKKSKRHTLPPSKDRPTGEPRHHEHCARLSTSGQFIFPNTKCNCGAAEGKIPTSPLDYFTVAGRTNVRDRLAAKLNEALAEHKTPDHFIAGRLEREWAQYLVGRCFVIRDPMKAPADMRVLTELKLYFTIVSYDPDRHVVSMHTPLTRQTGIRIERVVALLLDGTAEEADDRAPFTHDDYQAADSSHRS